MAPIVIQFPNCRPEEVPMEEVFFVLKVKGLSIDGTIDPGCECFGYVAHIRKGMKGATENFFNGTTIQSKPNFVTIYEKRWGTMEDLSTRDLG